MHSHLLLFVTLLAPLLVLQTSRSQLLFYGLQQTAEQVVPGQSGYAAVQPFVKEHAYLPHDAPPLALAADARSVLVAHTDGCVSTTTWSGKVGGLTNSR
jgi:hypothetical protein